MNKISQTFWAYKNKVTRKLWGYASVKAVGAKKGDVLLSYITTPFTIPPWEIKTDPHSNYWECREIARLFSVRGYDVDIINANEHRFIPKKSYAACIDVQQDLERLAKYLPATCKKVIHIDNPDYKIYNEREKKRLADLEARRGRALSPKRQVAPTRSLEVADYFEGFGNESVFSTYRDLGKSIFPIPVSIVEQFDFPLDKDFKKARTNFLYFGGGGAVLKGLDLVVEAFASLPDLTLHILGPGAFEPDFAKEYEKELTLPNIIRYGRPKMNKDGHITVNGRPLKELFDMCGAIVYPSSAEGTSTAVVQSIHGGLIPIITPETGLHSDVGGILLTHPSVSTVQAAAINFSQLSEDSIRDMARHAWMFVRSHHTREKFSEAYAKFINTVLKI